MLSAATPASNPLVRAAARVPGAASRTVLIAAQLAGAAFAIFYAYDQDTLFPDRHFARVWLLAVVAAIFALITLVPWERLPARYAWIATAFAALGPSVLIFAGANLAQRDSGVAVVVAGLVALAALFALASRLGRDRYAVAFGLFAGAGLVWLISAISVVFVNR